MKLTVSNGFKICDERDHPLHFETETETFALWSQNLRLRLILLKSVSNFETDTETFGRWSQSLRPALRPLWSQSQSRDQSLAHLCKGTKYEGWDEACSLSGDWIRCNGCMKEEEGSMRREDEPGMYEGGWRDKLASKTGAGMKYEAEMR